MVIVKFSLLILKISLLIFLQNHLINRGLIFYEMNLGLLISICEMDQFMFYDLLADLITWMFTAYCINFNFTDYFTSFDFYNLL